MGKWSGPGKAASWLVNGLQIPIRHLTILVIRVDDCDVTTTNFFWYWQIYKLSKQINSGPDMFINSLKTG